MYALILIATLGQGDYLLYSPPDPASDYAFAVVKAPAIKNEPTPATCPGGVCAVPVPAAKVEPKSVRVSTGCTTCQPVQTATTSRTVRRYRLFRFWRCR
jgi:hypothetical protein